MYNGLSSMLYRYIKKVESFGFYDLKGKRATNTGLTGMPIEQIHVLCDHAINRSRRQKLTSNATGTELYSQTELT